MTCTPAHACLIRRLRKALLHDPDEWIRFCIFARRIRFSGDDFAKLTDEQLAELSKYATKARL